MGQKNTKFKSPMWMQWLMIGFVAIAIASQFFKDAPPTDPGNPQDKPKELIIAPPVESKTEKSEDFLGSYKAALFPYVPKRVQIENVKEGDGPKAVCGSEVSVVYDAKYKDGTVVDSNRKESKPLTFIVGENKAMPALSQASEGMKKGGLRKFISPAALAYGHPDHKKKDVHEMAPIYFEMDMVEVKHTAPEEQPDRFGYRIHDNKPPFGWYASCGDKVAIHAIFWDNLGAKLYDSKLAAKEPLRFTIGASEVPFGLEQAVIGLSADIKRTAFLPPSHLKPLVSSKNPWILGDLVLPQDSPIIVDLELLPESIPQK